MDLPTPDSKAFSSWCVMTHARPALIRALRTWGMNDAALAVEQAASLSALRLLVGDADQQIRREIRFTPLRRDLSHAAVTLQTAITFAGRGDAENTAAVVIGVFTNAASAQTWKRPWTRFGWRKQRSAIIAQARREQSEYRAANGPNTPSAAR